jgi:predicted amidohydrolase YtcJ
MNSIFTFHFKRVLTLFPMIVTILIVTACSHVRTGTIALINGKVYTVNPKMPWAEAVVIDSNTIVFVGSRADAEKYIGKETKVIDLNGRMVMPGFIDAHMHPALGSFVSSAVLLDYFGTTASWFDIIRKTIKENPDRKYYFFANFRSITFGPEGPRKSDLDDIESKKPVIVFDNGFHSAWVNSKALELAGIDKNTPDPVPGGHYYVRDKNGNPTGYCIEGQSFIPIILNLGVTPEDIMNLEKMTFPKFSEYGITSVYDAGFIMEPEIFQAYLQLEKEGNLPIRVYASHWISNPKSVPTAVEDLQQLDKTYRSNLFRVNTMKIMLDGTSDALSAAMFNEYLPGGKGNGFILLPEKELSDFVCKIDSAGFNIQIHSIGDRAISEALTAFENLKQKKGLTPTRKTVVHCQFFMPNTIERFKALQEVMANFTPSWMVSDPATLKIVGPEVYGRNMLFNSMDKAGVRIACGTDFPVGAGMEDVNPFKQIEIGHMRRNIGAADTDILPPATEKMPLETLIRSYTINGAYEVGAEDIIGSLEPGKRADIIVLDKNLFEQKTDDIHNNKVLLTVMDGKVVFDNLK